MSTFETRGRMRDGPLFEWVRDETRFRCEIGDDGFDSIGVQFFKNDEPMYRRRHFVSRRLAVEWARRERALIDVGFP